MGSVGIVGLSGCLGVLGLDGHRASPAGVDAATRESTGYEQTGVDELVIEEKVDLKLWSESITVTNYVTEHEKSVSVGPLFEQRAAVFVVLSTPQITVARQQVNPVEDMSTDELVELVAENYDEIDNVQRESDDEVTILGETTTESTFVADAVFGGQNVRVNLHVTQAVATDDDLVVAIGVYPRDLEGRERENVQALMEAVVDDVDEDETEEDPEGGDGSDGGDGDGGDDGSEDNESKDDEDGDGVLGSTL